MVYLEDHDMICIGLRCSNTDLSYAILSGSKAAPQLVASDTLVLPQGYTRPQALKWLLLELEGLSKKHSISLWAIKGAEAIAKKGREFVERIENEAMILLHAGNINADKVIRKVKATIAKDLGLPGKASALTTDLDASVIPQYKNASDKIKEAVLVAWSELK
jgi:phosphohistidine swiveling domain-containing protein